MPTKNQPTQPVKVLLKLKDGQELKTEGKSILAALEKLPKLDPIQIKATGIISVEAERGRTERFLNINQVKALFNSKIKAYKNIFAKNLELFLK